MADVVEQATGAAPTAMFKKRKANTKIRKRPATPPPASDDSEYSSEDESGVRVKRRKKAGVAVTAAARQAGGAGSLGASKFEADKSTSLTQTNDATRQSNWYDEKAEDAMSAQQLLGKSSHTGRKDDVAQDDGTYKGSANYSSFISKNPNAPQKQVGPQKAPTNIRTITTMDFKPDICKDYAKTGYCGFGDSCIFLHDRADWKQGWQLDRDWEIETKGKKQQGTTFASANRLATKEEKESEEEAKLLENIPFACPICEKPYRKPAIVTKCGHYFCEKCALDRYKKNPSCAICGSGTNGVFNNAKNLNKLLDKKREREKRIKEQEEQEDEGNGD